MNNGKPPSLFELSRRLQHYILACDYLSAQATVEDIEDVLVQALDEERGAEIEEAEDG